MLIEVIIEALNEQIRQAKRLFESAKEQAVKAPSRMESRYDSTREELSWKAGQLAGNLRTVGSLARELQRLAKLHRVKPSPELVTDGVEVLLRAEGSSEQECDSYFIVPFGGGFDIEHDGRSVFVISRDAPIAIELLGKKVHDRCQMGDREAEIVAIRW